jgi:hypothetical protein
MQVFRARNARLFSTTFRTAAPLPWFVDKAADVPPRLHPIKPATAPPVPPDAPEVIKHLHSQLVKSPLLDKSHLLVTSAVLPEPGPPLPLRKPQGRRKTGGTYAGESDYEAVGGGIWNWVVMSQVRNFLFMLIVA